LTATEYEDDKPAAWEQRNLKSAIHGTQDIDYKIFN